ncbi:MAG TPA: hypothetical protein CFH79_09365 [Sulfurospirillum sp. UBA11407]|nr:MAG TPA: hypothetical protein CFH79_09365 [Sulfurospirillum sp. UBA11407]
MKKLLTAVVVLSLSVGSLFADAKVFTEKFKAQVKEAKSKVKMISPQEALKMMEEKQDFIIIDVRDKDEVTSMGYPKWDKYKNMSRGKLEPMLGKSDLVVENSLMVFCKTGARAALAAQTLQEYGFKNVVVVDGGMDKWLENNYPSVD